MGPGYFIIAILGCSDGAIDCAPVMTIPTHYENESACAEAAPHALVANSNFDFPELLAQCQSVARPAATKLSPRRAPGRTTKA